MYDEIERQSNKDRNKGWNGKSVIMKEKMMEYKSTMMKKERQNGKEDQSN